MEQNEVDKLKEEIRQHVLEELKSEREKELALRQQEREEERKAYEEYVTRMKESKDPWVDVQGWAETEQGVRVELDWNDAFVLYLREQGITGTDDDQVVQKWVTLLLRDMADQMEENEPTSGEFE